MSKTLKAQMKAKEARFNAEAKLQLHAVLKPIISGDIRISEPRHRQILEHVLAASRRFKHARDFRKLTKTADDLIVFYTADDHSTSRYQEAWERLTYSDVKPFEPIVEESGFGSIFTR